MPTVLQIAGVVLPSWAAISVGILSCALIATMVDLSIGVNTPYAFYKWSAFTEVQGYIYSSGVVFIYYSSPKFLSPPKPTSEPMNQDIWRCHVAVLASVI